MIERRADVPQPGETVIAVDRHVGRKGGPNIVDRADIIARNQRQALKAAQEGRVTNWRQLDTFDTAGSDYEAFSAFVVKKGDFERIRTDRTARRPLPRQPRRR